MMAEKPTLIPKKIAADAEKIREMLKQPHIQGVYIMKSRGAGKRLLQELIAAQDAELVEPKQLPEKTEE